MEYFPVLSEVSRSACIQIDVANQSNFSTMCMYKIWIILIQIIQRKKILRKLISEMNLLLYSVLLLFAIDANALFLSGKKSTYKANNEFRRANM